MAKKQKRPYVKRARKEQMEQTRARIVDAVVALHEEVGPLKTTVASIAVRAGVQRLTVYRHFPDEAALLSACSHRYTQLHPPPDPSQWEPGQAPADYVETAVRDLFDYYSRTAPMLTRIYRDAPEVTPLAEIMRGFDSYLQQIADDLAQRLSGSDGQSATRATTRHLVKFSTWQSLEQDGQSNPQKLALAHAWLASSSLD